MDVAWACERVVAGEGKSENAADTGRVHFDGHVRYELQTVCSNLLRSALDMASQSAGTDGEESVNVLYDSV